MARLKDDEKRYRDAIAAGATPEEAMSEAKIHPRLAKMFSKRYARVKTSASRYSKQPKAKPVAPPSKPQPLEEEDTDVFVAEEDTDGDV